MFIYLGITGGKLIMKRLVKIIVPLCLFLVLGYEGAKADTTASDERGAIIRATNLSTDKVIKVPKAEDREISYNTKVGSKVLSRGVSGTGSSVIAYSKNFLGRPYVWGGSGPRVFDCSGFTAYVYAKFGVSLPHYTGSQYSMGKSVSRSNLRAGDLIFFNTDGPISHVGIYIGGGEFIHASSGSGRITISDLSQSYYSSRYAGARRYLN